MCQPALNGSICWNYRRCLSANSKCWAFPAGQPRRAAAVLRSLRRSREGSDGAAAGSKSPPGPVGEVLGDALKKATSCPQADCWFLFIRSHHVHLLSNRHTHAPACVSVQSRAHAQLPASLQPGGLGTGWDSHPLNCF